MYNESKLKSCKSNIYALYRLGNMLLILFKSVEIEKKELYRLFLLKRLKLPYLINFCRSCTSAHLLQATPAVNDHNKFPHRNLLLYELATSNPRVSATSDCQNYDSLEHKPVISDFNFPQTSSKSAQS